MISKVFYQITRNNMGVFFSKSKNSTMSANSISQFSSVAQLCLTLYDPMNLSMPGLPVHHQLPESTQTHVH